jgi:lipoprotein NlpI
MTPTHYTTAASRTSARGGLAAAEGDLAKAMDLEPTDSEDALWLYLARARSGKNAASSLNTESKHLDLKTWPAAVVLLYLGRGSPEDVLAAAKVKDMEEERQRICEAYFYLGEDALLRGRRADALDLLRKATKTGPATSFAYLAAEAELARLGAGI